ncbi:MAG: 16S rRNA (adenine(1518)-N(6)/adenine(1519)-N(6))-dimethyltransferase RsmA [Gammaproteobacteria bacterium]|nr:16S rRNA (adenine(1518)-N(6)/adenine(1519)-N(6))-dimethyltransferase RsmA [Gammaproteobacteria bacterium]MDH5777916.1 16S rRNA (adenine(1518)-N(6)/adenine(1519)-N(6))-dimethyltransferase RsmA [Gammaproteobacteria bacterium]
MNHRPRKRFGQNFLHDQNIIHQIINHISPQLSDHIVEIGPGQGAITSSLVASAGKIDVIELDRDLIPRLEQKFSSVEQLTIHQADALKFDFCQLTENKIRVVGNLPYNISTPLLFHLMNQSNCITDMHFMLQKEVVDRITASPGTKQYGRLTIMLNYYCQSEKLMTIGPGAFNPPPKVDSAIIRLIPHSTPPVQIHDLDLFSEIITQAFSQRRKTIRNSVKSWLDQSQIESLSIDPGLRPEQLNLNQFADLANAAQKNRK